MSDWPAQSPDINVIENLWSVLKSRVNKRLLKTAQYLWTYAEEEWGHISKSEVIKLFDSIPRRLTAVIRNKGHHVKY